MKKLFGIILFAFAWTGLYPQLFEPEVNHALQLQKDSLERKFDSILSEKEAAIERAHASRNMGINFSLGGALLGFVCVSYGFFYQYQKTKKVNARLEAANIEIKKTQEQLIQSEKMAAYGIMASRMVHEIQNPLNFVNNFSELSQSLLQDVIDAKSETDKSEAVELLSDNLMKINQHGKRAGKIVRDLEEHSRSGTAHQYFET